MTWRHFLEVVASHDVCLSKPVYAFGSDHVHVQTAKWSSLAEGKFKQRACWALSYVPPTLGIG